MPSDPVLLQGWDRLHGPCSLGSEPLQHLNSFTMRKSSPGMALGEGASHAASSLNEYLRPVRYDAICWRLQLVMKPELSLNRNADALCCVL